MTKKDGSLRPLTGAQDDEVWRRPEERERREGSPIF